MSQVNLFEEATRKSYRFPFKGMISVEDLWVLTPRDLDSIFKKLNAQVKQVKEESLLKFETEEDKDLKNKIDIVKHIVQVKINEANARQKEHEMIEKKQQILEILSTKENEELHNKSPEELRSMLDELGE